MAWNLYITNGPKEKLPTSVIEALYKVRWQIELSFKLAKSKACLDETESENPHRVMCEFYAKLIALILLTRILQEVRVSRSKEISEFKAWERLKDKVNG